MDDSGTPSHSILKTIQSEKAFLAWQSIQGYLLLSDLQYVLMEQQAVACLAPSDVACP